MTSTFQLFTQVLKRFCAGGKRRSVQAFDRADSSPLASPKEEPTSYMAHLPLALQVVQLVLLLVLLVYMRAIAHRLDAWTPV